MEEHIIEKRGIPLPVFVTGCILCLVLGAAAALLGLRAAIGTDGLALLQAKLLIQERFVGEYDPQEQREAVLGTMVYALGDQWSYYLTPEDYQQVVRSRKNVYVGIGVTIDTEDEEDGILILAVTPDSPAEEAGILAGERIVGVEGTEVTQKNQAECVEMIHGEEGSQVELEVQGEDGARRSLTVTRRTIQVRSVEWSLLEDGVGLVSIRNFYSGSAAQVRRGVQELLDQGMTALVLDVRNNPGGYVTELTDILDLLLPAGEIFISREGREEAGGREKIYRSDAACVDLPMAVLVNAESYSAAEFLAAQLRESAGAVVAGTRTSGKGYSQKLYPLLDGSAVGLSTARYFTGGGTSLIGKGVRPDPRVSLGEKEEMLLQVGRLAPAEDAQLQAALEALAERE